MPPILRCGSVRGGCRAQGGKGGGLQIDRPITQNTNVWGVGVLYVTETQVQATPLLFLCAYCHSSIAYEIKNIELVQYSTVQKQKDRKTSRTVIWWLFLFALGAQIHRSTCSIRQSWRLRYVTWSVLSIYSALSCTLAPCYF